MDGWVVFFGLLALAGVGYFLLSLLGGVDVDIPGGLDLDFLDGDGESGCMAVAAVVAIFGAVGLLGVLSGWNIVVTLAAAGVVGLLVGRLTGRLMGFLRAQQSEPIRPSDVIGLSGRMTINTPAGKTGEAIFSDNTVAKYPVRAVDGEALKQGAQVVVVEVQGGILYVRRSEA